MSRGQLETWLLEWANSRAILSRSEFEETEREIGRLKSMLSSTEEDHGDRHELEALRHTQAALVQVNAEKMQTLQQLSEELSLRAESLLAQLEKHESDHVLENAQRLFDSRAPDYLSQPLKNLSLPLLRTELAQSSLVTDLQRWLHEEFEVCAVTLQAAEEDQKYLQRTQAAGPEGQTSMEQVSESLKDHMVDPVVMTTIRELKDPVWYLEEVLQPYLSAAVAEARWGLSRSILEDLG